MSEANAAKVGLKGAPDWSASLRALLKEIHVGTLSVEDGVARLRDLPFENLGFARLDHHRTLRTGFSEVIFCQGKTPQEVATLFAHGVVRSQQVLGTRATHAQYEATKQRVTHVEHDPRCGLLWVDGHPQRTRLDGVVVVTAGTSDLPVAEEAARTLDLMGHAPQRITDVGVAGLHRLLEQLPVLQRANVVVVVAGMEGALPSVVAGLIAAPVIAVPTSIGYGASFHGLAALLGMLTACAPGISVVNIDNGFGAGCVAAKINHLAHGQPPIHDQTDTNRQAAP